MMSDDSGRRPRASERASFGPAHSTETDTGSSSRDRRATRDTIDHTAGCIRTSSANLVRNFYTPATSEVASRSSTYRQARRVRTFASQSNEVVLVAQGMEWPSSITRRRPRSGQLSLEGRSGARSRDDTASARGASAPSLPAKPGGRDETATVVRRRGSSVRMVQRTDAVDNAQRCDDVFEELPTGSSSI